MKLDENLSEISLITKDAFEPTLPLSVVMHIDYKKAPMIIQRFVDVKKLVEQTLDPMVSAYFRNIGQKMTLIELLQNRAAIQEESSRDMKGKFAAYSLELQEVLIGTPRASQGDQTIENILIQLRSRQGAREQVTTFQEQEKAAVQERALNEAKATAAAQTALTQSLIQIKVHENDGAAALARAQKDAETVKVTAAAKSHGSRAAAKPIARSRSAARLHSRPSSPWTRTAARNTASPSRILRGLQMRSRKSINRSCRSSSCLVVLDRKAAAAALFRWPC